jgi:hypothetical protein
VTVFYQRVPLRRQQGGEVPESIGDPNLQWRDPLPALGGIAKGIYGGIADTAKSAIESAGDYAKTGEYDPAPVVQGALMAAGTTMPFAKAGAAGTFGGKLFSTAREAVDKAGFNKAQPSQWLSYLRNQPGVKGEELDWMGTPEFLQSQPGAVTKDQLAAHVREHQLELQDVTKGVSPEETARFQELRRISEQRTLTEAEASEWSEYVRQHQDNRTKFSSYTLPGGENYREMLLTMPKTEPAKITALRNEINELVSMPSSVRTYRGEDRTAAFDRLRREIDEAGGSQLTPTGFRSSHFDEPNILAHVRFNDRDIGGKKTLFIEEVQSDWHQAGRRQGYQTPPDPEALREATDRLGKARAAVDQRFTELMAEHPGITMHQASLNDARIDALSREFVDADNALHNLKAAAKAGVPDAPFKTSWPELALKRILKYAADHDYDQVAWTPGHVQAARYDLSKHVDYIDYAKEPNGNYRLGVVGKNGQAIDLPKETFTPNELANYVGKDVADKIIKGEGQTGGGRTTLRGLDLKVGGEGMNAFYDQILPSVANKVGKKFGAKVARGEIAHGKIYKIEPVELSDSRTVYDVRFNENGGEDRLVASFHTRAEAEKKLAEFEAKRGTPVHTLPITDALKRMAKEKGFPLFKRGGGVRYERVALKGQPAQGVKVPTDVIDRLGGGDRILGIAVLADTLKIHVLHGGIVDAGRLAAIGDGDRKIGERVLRSFIAHVRRQSVSQIHSKQ